MRLRLLRRWKKPAAPAPVPAPVPAPPRPAELDNPYGRVYTPTPSLSGLRRREKDPK